MEKTTIAGEQVVYVASDTENSQQAAEQLFEYAADNPNDNPVLVRRDTDKGQEYVVGQGGTLSDRELHVAHSIGHVVCDPLPAQPGGAQINGSSIDVTLGHYFYSAGSEHTDGGMFNPFSQEDTYRYFNVKNPETDYLEAKPWAEVKRKLSRTVLEAMGDPESIEGIPDEHPMILLRPNERILAHTHEFIGILPPGTTSMQARSTTGRIGLSACYCAGWGDPGYINRWTMEVHNLNENEHLPVPVGYRIAQVVFSTTGPVGTEYSQATGNYQASSSDDLAATKKLWRPHFVLPKAYKNNLALPQPVEGLAEGLK